MCRWLQATDANYATTQMLGISRIPALASYDTSGQIRLKRSLLPWFSKNTTRPHRRTASNLYVCAAIRGSQETGGACRDRTDDPLLAKQVLSQLS